MEGREGICGKISDLVSQKKFRSDFPRGGKIQRCFERIRNSMKMLSLKDIDISMNLKY